MDVGNSPTFTVVIMAHDRKKYIMDAIASVLHQIFPREEFEIILVKNFNDDSIDSFVNGNSIISIYTNERELSGKMTEGIRNSKGKYVCFLEDDDLFEENKLERIASFARSHGDLSFYHNSYSAINEEGKPISATDLATNEEAMIFQGKEQILAGLRYMLKVRADWHGSMMCIRREHIIPYLDELHKAQGSADKSLFYFSLLDGNTVIMDGAQTTRYRFHQSHTNVISEYDEFYRRRSKFFQKSYSSSNIVKEVCRGTFLERVASCSALHERLLYLLTNSSVKYSIIAEFKGVLHCTLAYRNRSTLFWYMFLILKKLTTRAALKLYYHLNASFNTRTTL